MIARNSARLVWDSKNNEIEGKFASFQEVERVYVNPLYQNNPLFSEQIDISLSRTDSSENAFFQGDNLAVIECLLQQGYRGKIDLIYIDPPYLSNHEYISRIAIGNGENKQALDRSAFDDVWENSLDSYLDGLYPRLLLMKDLLSPNGSIFVHLDWHVSHYVKLLLDEIFSSENFINEIVWCYGGGSGSKKHFHRKHDLIFWYARSDNYIFNPQYRPYSAGTIQRGLTKVKGDRYSLHEKGALMQDWWADINKILSPTAQENLKYPTQKPEALLRRIIATASQPGSLVADFYAGSGTTIEVCEDMERNWIACDSSDLALQISLKRLIQKRTPGFKIFKLNGNEQHKINRPKLFCKLRNEGDHEKESNLIISIDSYQPSPENAGKLKPNANFCLFIDFWEIDLNYNGFIFNSDLQVLRKSGFDQEIAVDINLMVPKVPIYRVAVKVWDVFAENTMQVLELKTE
ncbi:MAG: site-specific DNA-methyltransferase [Syntrophomonadaceae bacterium]|nr:site-specific DNA-methyltransferase [Syntrophomonadaceae bacterium]